MPVFPSSGKEIGPRVFTEHGIHGPIQHDAMATCTEPSNKFNNVSEVSSNTANLKAISY